MGGDDAPEKTAAENEYDALRVQQLQQQMELQGDILPLLRDQLTQSTADTAKSRRVQDRLLELQAGTTGTPLTATEEAQAQQAYTQFQQSQRTNDIQSQLQELQLEAIKNGGRATPEQAALIDESTAAAQRSGESDITRFLQQTQRQINEETAASAGLRPTDTPIVRLSERAGEEAARQQGQLTLGLQKAGADAKLNYPLAAQGVQTAATSAAGSLGLAAEQFRAQLSQQAADNRLRLAQNPITSGLGFVQGPTTLTAPGARPAQDNTLGQVGQLASGVGALLSFSDKRLKTGIKKVGEIDGINVYDYEIFGEPERGVLAQEVMKVRPDAVELDKSGFLKVNYSSLGLARHA